MGDSRKALVERLFAQHSGSLRAFFGRRIRQRSDASDLMQEVYLRILRVRDPEALRNAEAYLFTVASNLVKEHALLDQRLSQTTDIDDAAFLSQVAELPVFDAELDTEARLRRLQRAVEELSPKCRATLTLRYDRGLDYKEIGRQLGISSHMVKKYLAHALAHCRKRMSRWR